MKVRVDGIKPDVINTNGRIYPRAVLERAIEKYKERIKNRTSIVYLEPKDPCKPSLNEIGGVLTDIQLEPDAIYVKFEPLENTERAKVVTTAIMTGYVRMISCGRGTVQNRKVGEDFTFDHFCLTVEG